MSISPESNSGSKHRPLGWMSSNKGVQCALPPIARLITSLTKSESSVCFVRFAMEDCLDLAIRTEGATGSDAPTIDSHPAPFRHKNPLKIPIKLNLSANFEKKLQKSCIFLQKYLRNSKISCNFAAFLQIRHLK